MPIIHPLLQKLQNDVQELQKGLQPDHLSFWYQKIISDTKEMAPPWLQDKINVKQDPILPMKFNLDISKRAVQNENENVRTSEKLRLEFSISVKM